MAINRDNGDPRKCVSVNITLPKALVDAIEKKSGRTPRSAYIRAVLVKHLRLPEFSRVYAGGKPKGKKKGKK